MTDIQGLLLFAGAFAIIAVASARIGGSLTRLRLPLITGFLLTGMVAGPYGLGLISAEATARLRFVDEMALGFIALAAGGELYLRELRGRLGGIAWITGGLVSLTFVLGTLTVYLLTARMPFLAAMGPAGRLAVAMLAGAILVARSPSSAIAVVKELRARGPFTRTVLGVTVITDVVVIVAFAGASALAEALLASESFEFGFLGLLAAELAASLAVGIVVGRLLGWLLGQGAAWRLRAVILLACGYGVFALSAWVGHVSRTHLPWEFLLEPLFTCMVAGFVVTNLTGHRHEFAKVLHDTGPPVYVVFFTLTGASLALDVLGHTWAFALVICGIRLLAIYLGAAAGGALAGNPARHNRIAWAAFVTQAGVGLGLAKETAVMFPGWGESFATVMIAVIVMNQVVGPPLAKWALHRAGETHERARGGGDRRRRFALVFGLEDQSLALARQLREHDWEVRVASRRAHERQEEVDASELDIRPIADLGLETLRELEVDRARAVVALLPDEDSLELCELLYEHFGTETVVVRVHDRRFVERFHELGVMIVDPGTALVGLLDHSVRSPAATSLLLGLEPGQDVVDVELRNHDLHGTALRDVRLPLDALVLYVNRGERHIQSHGFTRLELGDRVTVMGSEESIDEVRLRFDA